MSRIVHLTTTLPTGPPAALWISLHWIVVRVGDRACVVHRPWMGFAELAELARALTQAAQWTPHRHEWTAAEERADDSSRPG